MNFRQQGPRKFVRQAKQADGKTRVSLADTAQSFVEACQAALSEDTPEARQKRLELGRQNSWDSRIKKLSDLMLAALPAAR